SRSARIPSGTDESDPESVRADLGPASDCRKPPVARSIAAESDDASPGRVPSAQSPSSLAATKELCLLRERPRRCDTLGLFDCWSVWLRGSRRCGHRNPHYLRESPCSRPTLIPLSGRSSRHSCIAHLIRFPFFIDIRKCGRPFASGGKFATFCTWHFGYRHGP